MTASTGQARATREGARVRAGGIASSLAPLNRELWLARRLGRRGVLVEDLFHGVTDAAERKRRLRQAIVDRHVADVRCGRDGAGPITYRAAFERIFGEPL